MPTQASLPFMDLTSDSVAELPKTLRILGKRFKIRILKPGDEDEVDGLMKLCKQEIAIRPQEAIEQVQDTTLHEVIHAIDESLRLRMTETQVHKLATSLLAVLKDNEAYSCWLIKND